MSMTKQEQSVAFIKAARTGQHTVKEIAALAGLQELDAWEVLARGHEAGRLAIRDEDRTRQWIEVLPLGGSA